MLRGGRNCKREIIKELARGSDETALFSASLGSKRMKFAAKIGKADVRFGKVLLWLGVVLCCVVQKSQITKHTRTDTLTQLGCTANLDSNRVLLFCSLSLRSFRPIYRHHHPLFVTTPQFRSRWTICSISAGSRQQRRKLSRNNRLRHQASAPTPTQPSLRRRPAANPTTMAPPPLSPRPLLASRHRRLPLLHLNR